MGNNITLDIELRALKIFLDKTLEIVDTEKATIFEQEKSGEFHQLDDFSNALFFPEEQESIAIRAVFYEVNTLVEWELRILAIEPYRNSVRFNTKPKFLGDSHIASQIKFVYDLPIGEIHRLLEEYYKINLLSLPSSDEIYHIRRVVNAFKHRKGFKDSRREPTSELPEKFQLTREDAYQAIDGARIFLKALWKKSKV